MHPTLTRLEMLHFFEGLLPLNGVCTYLVDGGGQPFGHLLRDMPADQIDAYRAVFHKVDPFHPSRFLDSGLGVVDMDATRRTPDAESYVTGFLHAHDLHHELQLFLRNGEGRLFAGVGLFRNERAGPFRSAEINLCARVRPLAECALRAHFDVEEADAGQGNLAAWSSAFALTGREGAVLDLLVKGASNAAIAEALDIKVSTAKVHVFHIFSKVGVTSRGELLAELLSSAPQGRRKAPVCN